jgi:uncharacterized SAM-binding protein YcdF (DUF218 family)
MTIESAAQLLWDYHHLHDELKPAECLFVLGSSDISVADRAAELYGQGLAPLVLVAGGAGRYTKDVFAKSEADVFAERMIAQGVPEEAIVREDQSTNTGDNFVFGMKRLKAAGHNPGTIIAVTKPYMERRAYATAMKQLSGVSIQMASPTTSWANYPTAELPRDKIINIMVGDTQRVIEYPKLGFQIAQDVPGDVREAMDYLVAQGYDKSLIRQK